MLHNQDNTTQIKCTLEHKHGGGFHTHIRIIFKAIHHVLHYRNQKRILLGLEKTRLKC